MQIGNLTLSGNIFLAPMAGVTDLPFRLLCKEQGASLVYTEMISAKAMHYNDADTIKLTETHPDERAGSCANIRLRTGNNGRSGK